MALFQVTMPGRDSTGGAAGTIAAGQPLRPEPVGAGYVDQSGLIQTVPHDFPAGTMVPYPDLASARRALDAGEIPAYYIVPQGYLTTGRLVAVRPAYNPLSPPEPTEMDWVLLVNLLGGDVLAAGRVWRPMELQTTALAPDPTPDEQADVANPYLAVEHNDFIRTLPVLVTLLLYGVILLSAGLALNSVSEEKKHRTMEILLTSISPRQMLTGKIIALGVAGLIQAAVWGAIGYLLFAVNGWTRYLPAGVSIPPSLALWGVVYFLLGYALYATLMAGAGALIPDLKETPMVSVLLAAPAFVGFEIGLWTAPNPHGALSTAASLFPLTAPFSMLNRLMIGGVPLWQVLLSTGLMVVTVPMVVGIVARVFRAQNLLSGEPFSMRRYVRVILGQA
jgi:ABC-2 type transport system permease protein